MLKMLPTKRMLQVVVLLGLSLMLASCSTRFVYNQLDWLLPWYINDYVSIETHQQDQLDLQIERLIAWHRTQQLPVYASFVKKLNHHIHDPTSPEQIESLLNELDALIDAIYLGVGEHLAPLLTTLSHEQKDDFIQNLTQRNIDYAEEYVNIGEVAARGMGAKKMTEIYDEWLGDVTQDQAAMIEDFTQSTQWMSPELLRAKQRWTEGMANTLKTPDPDQDQKLMALFDDRKRFWTERLKHQFERNRSLLSQHLTQIVASLTSEQQTHLSSRLGEYRTDFLALAKQSS
ncbi:MAG: DUF6279 family lipoprotein [Hydrogenovibrio sp.]|uniref:DUF6279 family lipoprotein n=1 Tax=Hydrogenovibrio sp. TaxID=2065821 RepID=UPI00287010D6|nr:DUF6279 family lipoprotein [Hydrogenovibrio sp.]MDR9499917.1 DUF6279 family lipoprotein [Hydrogenovibrio sp.]